MRLCIDVDDVERAIAFYTAALGLKVGRRFDATFVELLGGPLPIDLLGKQAGTKPTPSEGVREYSRHWCPLHFDVAVDDLERAIARAVAAGAKLEHRTTEVYGLMANMSDPFGHGFCLLQFIGRGYDAYGYTSSASERA